MSKHLPKDNTAVMEQVGWLGQSGIYYPLDTPLADIHDREPGSYSPVYIPIGTWEWNEVLKNWVVHYE